MSEFKDDWMVSAIAFGNVLQDAKIKILKHLQAAAYRTDSPMPTIVTDAQYATTLCHLLEDDVPLIAAFNFFARIPITIESAKKIHNWLYGTSE